MRLWMDVMRHLEPVMDDHERLFDAWEAGGVDGMVIGPMAFADKTFTFDPDPDVYARFGLEPPRAGRELAVVAGVRRRRGRGRPTAQRAVAERRDRLTRTLEAAKARGWQVWLFCPHYGAPPGRGPLLVDEVTRTATAARLVDGMEHYPMADGAVMDGPEWGYEIATFHQNRRSYIFDELPPSVAEGAERLGYSYSRLVAAKDRLFDRLHRLTDREVRLWGGGDGGFLGGFGLLGNDPGLAEWLAFRMDSRDRDLRARAGAGPDPRPAPDQGSPPGRARPPSPPSAATTTPASKGASTCSSPSTTSGTGASTGCTARSPATSRPCASGTAG